MATHINVEHLGTPGFGESLGLCAICGENFLVECLIGTHIKSFSLPGSHQMLYAHNRCIEPLAEREVDVLTLPEKSPLRKAYEFAHPEEKK